jgi:hypothetical protein
MRCVPAAFAQAFLLPDAQGGLGTVCH